MALTKVGGAVFPYEKKDMTELAGLVGRYDGQQLSLVGYHVGSDVGGGIFYWDEDQVRTNHNGGTIISPDRDLADEGLTTFLTTVTNASTGCWVRKDLNGINLSDFGAQFNGTSEDDVLSAIFNFVNNTTSTDNNTVTNSTGYTIIIDGDLRYSETHQILCDFVTLSGSNNRNGRLIADGSGKIEVGDWVGTEIGSVKPKYFRTENGFRLVTASTFTGSTPLSFERAGRFQFNDSVFINNVDDGDANPVDMIRVESVEWGAFYNTYITGCNSGCVYIGGRANDEGHFTFVGGALALGRTLSATTKSAAVKIDRGTAAATFSHISFIGTHFGSFPAIAGTGESYAILNVGTQDAIGKCILDGAMIEAFKYGIGSDYADRFILKGVDFYGNGEMQQAIPANGTNLAQYEIEGTTFIDLVDAIAHTGVVYFDNLVFSSVTGQTIDVTSGTKRPKSNKPFASGRAEQYKVNFTHTISGGPYTSGTAVSVTHSTLVEPPNGITIIPLNPALRVASFSIDPASITKTGFDLLCDTQLDNNQNLMIMAEYLP